MEDQNKEKIRKKYGCSENQIEKLMDKAIEQGNETIIKKHYR